MKYQYFDKTAVDNLKLIMGEDFVELFNAYSKDCKTRIENLDNLLKQTPLDYNRVRLLAHSLKGSSSNVGAVTMGELSCRLEQQAQEQAIDLCTFNAVKQHLSEMQLELDTIVSGKY